MQSYQIPLEIQSETDLLECAKAGDHSAYVELCRRHSAMAKRMVSRMVRNREDAEDILQDSMLNAYTHLHTFDGRSKFSTWFVRIAVNSALMLLRKQKRHRLESIEDLSPDFGTESIHFSDAAPSPESCAVQSQLIAHLGQAIHSLPPKLREVVIVRHLGDLSIEEVAERCDLSIPATKSRLMRARIKLASRMSPPYGEMSGEKSMCSEAHAA